MDVRVLALTGLLTSSCGNAVSGCEAVSIEMSTQAITLVSFIDKDEPKPMNEVERETDRLCLLADRPY